MFATLRSWLEARRRRETGIKRALAAFQNLRGIKPMGGHALLVDENETIVRVMYVTDHIPPDRAWFAVPHAGGDIRELSFETVRELESPWR